MGRAVDMTGDEALVLAKKNTEEVVSGHGFIQGKSAYEIAVEQGYTGTEQEWLDSLQGEPGEQGPQGEPGEKGDKGDPGAGGVSFTYNPETETVTATVFS